MSTSYKIENSLLRYHTIIKILKFLTNFPTSYHKVGVITENFQ